MRNNTYSAGLTSQSFWFLEFKQVVRLRQEGMNYGDIKEKCVNEERIRFNVEEHNGITHIKCYDMVLPRRIKIEILGGAQ